MNSKRIRIADVNPFDYEKKHYPYRNTVKPASVVRSLPEPQPQVLYQSRTAQVMMATATAMISAQLKEDGAS